MRLSIVAEWKLQAGGDRTIWNVEMTDETNGECNS